MHHISTIDNYRISKRDKIDVEVASPSSRPEIHRNANMMIFRDIDTQTHSDLVGISHLGERDFSSASPANPITNLASAAGRCGFVPTENDSKSIYERFSQIKSSPLLKRAATSSCFLPVKQVLPMGVAADCSYVIAMGSAEAALKKIISNWNSASQVYESTFYIALSIVTVKIVESCGNHGGETLAWNRDCGLTYTINDRLSDFSQWRGTIKDSAGLWHLMTKCK